MGLQCGLNNFMLCDSNGYYYIYQHCWSYYSNYCSLHAETKTPTFKPETMWHLFTYFSYRLYDGIYTQILTWLQYVD